MEVTATRDQIRARLLAKVGWATGGAVTNHYNELIREASVHVAEACPWASARREARLTIQTDQRYVTYPEGCGATGLLEMGLWIPEGMQYRRLTRHQIGIVRHSDPTNETGGATDEATRGEPVWFEPGEQIELWPNPDRAYELKIIYQLSLELTEGGQVAPVDAELILLWAASRAYRQIGDIVNAEDCEKTYTTRLHRIKARMQTAFAIPLAEEAGDDEHDVPRGYYASPVT